MTLEIRILNQGEAGELFRLRRSALLDSPLAFLASPEDDLASSEAAVRELLDPRRKSHGELSRTRFDSRRDLIANATCGFHWAVASEVRSWPKARCSRATDRG